jgi:predicted ATPase/DNA-binding SARP family transcriptional activator
VALWALLARWVRAGGGWAVASLAAAMEFRILGPLEVRANGRAMEISGAKRRALLAVLVLQANRPVSTQRLALALWGHDAPPGAIKAVQVQVSRLRRTLGETGVLETTPAGYRLLVGPGELDLDRVERAMAAGRDALAAGHADHAAELLHGALRLWHGAPLEEFAWAPFAPPEIRRLEELRLSAVEMRVEAELATGHHAELVAELQRLTNEHPWRERLHVQLMLALYRSGRQAEALAAYRDARAVLVEQLGIEPGAELHNIHQAVLAHDATLDAPTTALRRAGALPAAPNRTIGRATDIRTLTARLRAGETRLLTLTGPGGVGKTRLALEAARAVADEFADGTGFVSLAAVERPADVAAAIISAFRIVPLPGESDEEAVERVLAAKHVLLVVDNCEHLLAAAAFIGRLATTGPGVTVLATSREPLNVQPEQVHPVLPLALPEPGTEADLGALADVDAVALFCERARAHDPDFELNEEHAGAVATICRRLDGLPLAIELAAARCGLLAPAEIAARLHTALGAGGRDAPARQRTLRATLDWSHGLLDADEQACFAHFAVFTGGAEVPATETITRANVATLERLVAKSLLVRRREPRQPTRLGMLETVRAYAGERLAALPDGEAIRERHFGYFLALAQRHGTDTVLDGPERREHLARLDGEIGNLRTALQWAADQGAPDRVLELASALVDYWMRRERYPEAVDWLLPAVRSADATGNPSLRARALSKVCWPLWALGSRDELLPLLSEAEAIASTLAEPATRAEVLCDCAAVMCVSGRSEAAAPVADEAFACANASGDAWLIAKTAEARAMAAGSPEELRERVEQTAPLLERVGNARRLVGLLTFAAGSALGRGRDDDAGTYLQRALPLARELDEHSTWMHGNIGLFALLGGDLEPARDAFHEQLTLGRDLVMPLAASQALSGLAAVAATENKLELAARLAGAGAAHRSRVPDDPVAARLDLSFLQPARTRLGADCWDIGFSEGAALSIEAAIRYGLEGPHEPSQGLAPRHPR